MGRELLPDQLHPEGQGRTEVGCDVREHRPGVVESPEVVDGQIALHPAVGGRRSPRLGAGGVDLVDLAVESILLVHSQREAVGEPVPRLVADGHADGRALGFRLIVVLVGEVRSEAPESLFPRCGRTRPSPEAVPQNRVRRVVREGHPHVGARVPHVDGGREPLGGGEAEVRAPRGPVAEIVVVDALFAALFEREVVVEGLAAAAGRQVEGAEIGVAVGSAFVLPQGHGMSLDRIVCEYGVLGHARAARIHVRVGDVGRRAPPVVGGGVERPLVVPCLEGGIPYQAGTGAALLGDDLDDAAGRVGPVEGGGGRTLDRLDRLDVVRIQEIERVGALGAAPAHVQPTLGSGLHPNPIDVDDGLQPCSERSGAPYAQLGARPRLTRVGGKRQARGAGGEQLLHGADRRDLHDFGRVDRRYRVAHRSRLGPLCRAGDDDLIQLQRRLRQLEVGDGGLSA